MSETLLASNRRVGVALAVLATLSCALTGWCVLSDVPLPWRIGSAGLLLLGLCLLIAALWICFRPRLAIQGDELVVYLNAGKPLHVPLEVVEVFFIGQGAVSGEEPGQPKDYRGAVAANVIVRLAESADEWHRRDVNLTLGVWRDGYISVRGLWCENINASVLQRMNHRLAACKRERMTRGLES